MSNRPNVVFIIEDTTDLILNLKAIPFTGSRNVVDSLGRYKNVDTLISGMDFVSSVGVSATGLA